MLVLALSLALGAAAQARADQAEGAPAGSRGGIAAIPPAEATAPADEIHAVQKRPLREARRLELWAYGVGSVGDPYLQRWGGGLRAMYHLREGLSVGLDGHGFATFATEELVIAKRELHARVLESRQRASGTALVAIAPLYGKVALPGNLLVHFETFADAGLGAALTETDSGRGVRPLIAAGIGQRLFAGENLAFTLRLGGELYAERFSIAGQPTTHASGFWTLSFGAALYLPGQKGNEP
ncbi:MAG: hypothetical protein NVSMB23_03550 [Myxococcales bacterium]